jgi:hypothetical protein
MCATTLIGFFKWYLRKQRSYKRNKNYEKLLQRYLRVCECVCFFLLMCSLSNQKEKSRSLTTASFFFFLLTKKIIKSNLHTACGPLGMIGINLQIRHMKNVFRCLILLYHMIPFRNYV